MPRINPMNVIGIFSCASLAFFTSGCNKDYEFVEAHFEHQGVIVCHLTTSLVIEETERILEMEISNKRTISDFDRFTLRNNIRSFASVCEDFTNKPIGEVISFEPQTPAAKKLVERKNVSMNYVAYFDEDGRLFALYEERTRLK